MTVKEIAELAGVSIGTVDRVLHGRGRVSPATKARIEAIVRQRGFTPNPIARRLKRNRAYTFFGILPRGEEDSGYWAQAREGILGAADEIQGYGVETKILDFDRYDPESFRSVLRAAAGAEPDGGLLAPVVPEASRDFVRSIQGRIPYVFFDADLPGCSPLCAIGQDPFRGGFLAGRLACLFNRARPGVFMVLEAHGEDYHIMRRREGFCAYIARTDCAVGGIQGIDFERDAEAARLLAGIIHGHPELAGVFVTSASAHVVGEAVRELRKRRPFIVIGYDLVPANHRLLAEGCIDAIISQRPEIQGRQGLLNLYRSIVLGRSVEPRFEVPLDVYFKENMPVLSGGL